MNSFREDPVTRDAKNDAGVIVNTIFDRRFVYYEAGNLVYLIPKSTQQIRLEHGGTSAELYDILDLTGVREGGNVYGQVTPLPDGVLERLRTDLPQAYEALGMRCILKGVNDERI